MRFKSFKNLISRSTDNKKSLPKHQERIDQGFEELKGKTLSSSLPENLRALKEAFQNCADILFKPFTIGQSFTAVLVWTDGLVNDHIFAGDLMHSLMHESRLLHPDEFKDAKQAVKAVREQLVNIGDVKEKSDLEQVVDSILVGEAALLIEGYAAALIVSTKGWQMRPVSEPLTEGVVRGPRQGFTENLRTNTALIRRIIKTPQLKMENYKLGKMTKTDVSLLFIQGLAEERVIGEVRRRIQRIKIDSILESAYIEELIEDHPFSPFPQMAHTERPDKAAAELLEGKVVIITDGTPFVLMVPAVLVQFLQSNEDYYERYPMAFAIRALRYLFFIISLLLPSAYIGITTYHQEMLPTPLLVSIAGGRENVPFPAVIEALLMEVTFEALREAGVRLPRPVGQAVSIVGALVIGEAAVKAGIVSSAMVIVVSVTAIASFTVPAFNIGISFRMLRFPMMFLAAVLGFYGIALGLVGLLIHVCSLRSFGVPYFSPLAPFQLRGFKDVMFRAPWWMMKKRPTFISDQNVEREDVSMPKPPSDSNSPKKE